MRTIDGSAAEGLSMWFLFACAAPVPSEPVAIACAVTAEQVGVPGGRIEDCTPVAGFPEILQVRVDGTGHTVVVHGATVTSGGGLAALDRFIAGLPAARAASLDLPAVAALLRAFDAFPTDFDARATGFDLPEVGKSQFIATPFVLILYNGIPPEPRFVRATLGGHPLAWTREERQADGTWRRVTTRGQ